MPVTSKPPPATALIEPDEVEPSPHVICAPKSLAVAFHSDATLALARLSGSDQGLGWAHGLRTLVELRCGGLARALDHGEQARLLSEGVDANPFSAVNGGWFGEALVEAGQPARGRQQVLRALGGPELPAIEIAYRPYFYDLLAAAEAALGRREQGAAWASAASATAARLGLPGRDGAALHAAALAERDPATGARARAPRSRRSSHSLTRSRRPGRESSPVNNSAPRANPERALAELQQATDQLTALGATHYAAQAIRERRRLGEHLARGGRRASTSDGVASLSDREHRSPGSSKTGSPIARSPNGSFSVRRPSSATSPGSSSSSTHVPASRSHACSNQDRRPLSVPLLLCCASKHGVAPASVLHSAESAHAAPFALHGRLDAPGASQVHGCCKHQSSSHAASGHVAATGHRRPRPTLSAADIRASASAGVAPAITSNVLSPLARIPASPHAAHAGAPAACEQTGRSRCDDHLAPKRVMRVWVDSAGGRHYVAED